MYIEFDRVLFLKILVGAPKLNPHKGAKRSMKSLQENKNDRNKNIELILFNILAVRI